MSMRRIFPDPIEGRHVLMALGGFFGVMFLVNGIFFYYAVGTFNGFETMDAYRKGVAYNERIKTDVAQSARGWQSDIRYDPATGKLSLKVSDATGNPIAGLTISGEARRPVTDRNDHALTLSEIAPGQYESSLDLAPGQWIIIAMAMAVGSQEPTFRLKQRIWVKEAR